ncbi:MULTISPECIES: hypothetical protein [unclassified Thermosynechococcus]|uniref:hypothetical protein n=1 Tax=unclassified Thermosynechococcus TaxID=2622553 RepID=UPI00197FE649|nr:MULTISPECIES: hypothetical protein [unclassified Thermosynechococcus]QSF49242.1 hypothetical protein JW907_00125 [Thermosynechococcus sp. TA-1]WNC32549.1 hypothetical protein RHH81_00125 [Thermosynechococcus sp. PKX95]WNC35079.1 hypothetical protein RHH79_00125 [Thermosynechococcus sp. PKX91]WNC37595.1 hypothetical protein RHI11_00125 [Thermosynechococcus sp. WL11]WNC40116.1 hypothetical protein RHI18_00125 [Thermosynechococcus sp. WL17]
MSLSTRSPDLEVEQLPQLLQAARSRYLAGERSPAVIKPLSQVLQAVLERNIDSHLSQRGGYLQRLVEAYFRLFPRCLEHLSREQLQQQAVHKTVLRIVQIPATIIQDEYDRLNRGQYNQPLKQLVLAFSRPALANRNPSPELTEAECFLAFFIQCLRQELGATVLLSPQFRQEYRDLLRTVCLGSSDPEQCQSNLTGWLWEAMKSFDPLKPFGATGHGRPTFEAWVRTVINNKLADEKRKLLKREADELLFYDNRALQVFQDRYQAAPPEVQREIDPKACAQLITIVQTEITDPRIRASTARLRQHIAQLLGWTIEYTRDIHQQVRRILGRYVQSTRSLNICSTDSNQEWIDNYPDTRTLPTSNGQGVECIVEFLNDPQTPTWVRDWCERRRTQAEIARELFVSQPTISRCLGREYRLWLYRKFFQDPQIPQWMRRWYETQSIPSPHQRRQTRREIHPDYARGLCTAKQIDEQIEAKLAQWCEHNDIYYLP